MDSIRVAGDDLEMALERFLNPERGRVRRSKEGPCLDNPCVEPVPFEGSFSPGGFPLTEILEASFNRKGGERLMQRSNMTIKECFFSLFRHMGTSEEEVKKLFEGVSEDDLRNSPEIRRIIEEDFENNKKREEEKIAKAERERKRLELLAKLEALKPQLDAAEAKHKKLLEQREELLKSLS